jgi:hypothetical protein
MTTKCDFCQEDIIDYDSYSHLCSCGKITCSELCHKFQQIYRYNNSDELINICNDEILTYGEKGFIIYDPPSNSNKRGSLAILKDPNYEPMLDELKQLREKVAQLSVENQSLKIQIECAPGGIEYLSAKERFDTQNY